MVSPGDSATSDVGAEDDENWWWRFDSWREMGLSADEAVALANQLLSPSEVREFVRHRGCSVRMALRILL